MHIQTVQTRQDLLAVVDLHRDLLPFPVEEDYALAAWQEMGENPDYALLIVKEEDRVVGTITLIRCHGLAGPYMVMEDFVVQPGLRGQGIGTRLMAAADHCAREWHCCYGILVSSGFRKEAHRFYETHGFTEDVRGFRKSYD